MRGNVLILVCYLAVAACTAARTHTAESYDKMWDERIGEYQADLTSRRQQLETDAGALQVVLVSANPDLKDGAARIRKLLEENFEIAQMEGHGGTLDKFLQYRKTDPDWSQYDAWFDAQTNAIKETDGRTQAEFQAYLDALDSGKPNPNWLVDLDNRLHARGTVLGSADELIQIHKEMESYASDYKVAEQADAEMTERVAAALQALGAAMQQSAYQQQALTNSIAPYGNTLTITRVGGPTTIVQRFGNGAIMTTPGQPPTTINQFGNGVIFNTPGAPPTTAQSFGNGVIINTPGAPPTTINPLGTSATINRPGQPPINCTRLGNTMTCQ